MNIKKIIVGEIRTNSYIVSKNGKCFLVDPGDDAFAIIDAIKSDELLLILLTHGHFDHVLAIESLHKKFPTVPIYISGEDEHLLKELSKQNHYSSKEIKDMKICLKRVNEESEIIFIDEKIQVIKTPGHSHGSVCYLVNGNLFSGDTLFYHTIGRTDFWTSNHCDMISSLKKLTRLPKATKVYPGHGRITSIGEEAKNGYLGKIGDLRVTSSYD